MRYITFLLILGILSLNTGCNEDVPVIPDLAKAKIRFVNGISFAETIRIDIDSLVQISSLERGQYASITEAKSGGATRWQVYDKLNSKLLFQSFYTLGSGGNYLVFMKGSASNTVGFLAPLPDTLTSPFIGKAALRFVHLAEKIPADPALEVSSDGNIVTPFSIYSGDYTRLFPIDAGTHSILVHEEGKQENFWGSLPVLNFVAGKVYTIYTYDTPGIDTRTGVGYLPH